jgi:hypothetical protein
MSSAELRSGSSGRRSYGTGIDWEGEGKTWVLTVELKKGSVVA